MSALTIFHTGSVIVDEALPYRRPSDHPLAWTHLLRDDSRLVEVPVSCYLFEGPHGRMLIDTGWHPDNRTKLGQIANLRQQYPAKRAVLPQGQAIDEQLAQMGISPKDLDLVMLSHLHCDHADGLRLVKDAPGIMVSKAEWRAAKRDHLRYLPHQWKHVAINTYPWNTKIGPWDAGFDVYGDGSVVTVALPGHSYGLTATIIRSSNISSSDPARWVPNASGDGVHDGREFILLTSDAGYGRPSLEEDLRPGVVIKAGWARRSLDWIRQVSKDPRCLRVIASHDPEIIPETIQL